MSTTILTVGSTGADVVTWQNHLISSGYEIGSADGVYGPKTAAATRVWQLMQGLTRTGTVCTETAARAGVSLTLLLSYPPEPTHIRHLPYSSRDQHFGTLRYRANPDASIVVINDWQRQNLVSTRLPWQPPHAPAQIFWHRRFVDNIQNFFHAVDRAGIRHHILSWGGSWAPRLSRGSQVLSSHAYATAFDINATENGLNKEPARPGSSGCLYDVVSLANENGFWWGGHFERRDGMHFEIALEVRDR